MRNEYQGSRGTIGLHTPTSLPGDGIVQHDTDSGHMLLGTHFKVPPATASKTAVSDIAFPPLHMRP